MQHIMVTLITRQTTHPYKCKTDLNCAQGIEKATVELSQYINTPKYSNRILKYSV